MSKRSFRIAGLIVLATMLTGIGVVWKFVSDASEYPDRQHPGSGAEISVVIEPGMGFPQVAKRLAERGVIDRPSWFRVYGMKRGDTTKVRAGTYSLADNLTPRQVLDTLVKGAPEVTVRVTIPEGLHMLEVFSLFDKAGIADAQALEELARDPAFLRERGVDGPSIEGYLFPDTYHFVKPTAPKVVLDQLIKQYRIVWEQLRRENVESLAKVRKKLGWTDHEFTIMASIVEKEAVSDKERPTIAQVFMNRLVDPSFVPHRLDTDPTIRYGCTVPLTKSKACAEWDITDRLHRIQLNDAENPYNTYQHDGLPPGPICSPGRKSLEAVMKPDGSRFFFFVAMSANEHVFARTRAEHERNVDKYIRNR